LAINAPLGSVTTPLIDPVPVFCASAAEQHITAMHTSVKFFLRLKCVMASTPFLRDLSAVQPEQAGRSPN
jgi:hypothetical protein